MVIYFGADHRGFALKETLKKHLQDQGYEVVDLGAEVEDEDDDYTDFAVAVARKVSQNSETARGIILCGSGAGVSIAANKIRRIRCALGFSADQVFDARKDDQINILALAASFVDEEDAKKMVQIFLETQGSTEERYLRRLEKISQLENA